ncbi:MAG TPA: low molecular weight protein-tyrosine-phosphatase [Burkholderiaceae bacterium]|nr:low molecular weight protein-tyrosine-phosphatase [Burkholderiaceae bacterium]
MAAPMPELRVLMVCLGNICRSPTAEAVLRAKLDRAGLGSRVQVDSAGTGNWHVGEPPDARAQRHAAKRGYDLSRLRGRQVAERDFLEFDFILAMDRANLIDLHRVAPTGWMRAEVRLLADAEVPDPYTGSPADFERVLDEVESACERWVKELSRLLGAG